MRHAGPSRIALLTLGLGAFVVGTSELVVVGVLEPIADHFAVSVSAAGTLVTAYALGIALGGPFLTAATVRLDRGLMLRLALGGYVAGNLLTVAIGAFELLLATRFAIGSLHGLFIGVASVVAVTLAEDGREGRAMGMVFGGIALSTVIGVPLGTLVGQALGWEATFVVVAALGTLALTLTVILVPRAANGGAPPVANQARHALAMPVLITLSVGFLIIGGQFAALTYLEPFLARVTGISGAATSAFLLVFGVATAIGTYVGGRAADRSAPWTLIAANAALAATLVALYAAGPVPALTAAVLVAFGLVGFGLVSTSLQLRVISLAGPGGNLAASLGASAANAGIAAGALVGGVVVADLGVRYVTLGGALILALALPLTFAARTLKPSTGLATIPAVDAAGAGGHPEPEPRTAH